MDPLTTLSATPKAWLLNSVLAPHADAFVAHLKRGRYSPTTARAYLGSLAHEGAVERFLVRHVPHCDCPRPVICTRGDLRAACAHLLDVLREGQVIAGRPQEVGHIADELHRYDDYMQRVQGLIEGTRRGRLRIVRRLLLYKFADGPAMIAGLEADDVRKFSVDLRQARSAAAGGGRFALAGECHMSATPITQRAQTFLAERRRLGFQARTTDYALLSFARFMDRQ